jgi:tripartite-type tricarboxylate transporter receptor subunit TctC
MKMNRWHRLLALAGLALSISISAQEFKQPIKFIVPFAPGGATDVLARMVAPKISNDLGQPIVIENRTGASGQIGTQLVKSAPADGSTFLVTIDNTVVILPLITPNVPYVADRDFVMVGKMATLPWALTVPASSNIQNLSQFVELIKKDVKQANFAVPSAGGIPELVGNSVGKRAGVDMTMLPYAGGAAIISAVLGGQISSGVTGTPEAFQMAKSGKAVVIGVTGNKRSPYLPNVPTFEESGIKGLTMESWFAVFAPKALPQPLAEKFNKALNAALADPDIRRKIAEMSIEVVPTTLGEAAKEFNEAVQLWQGIEKAKSTSAKN